MTKPRSTQSEHHAADLVSHYNPTNQSKPGKTRPAINLTSHPCSFHPNRITNELQKSQPLNRQKQTLKIDHHANLGSTTKSHCDNSNLARPPASSRSIEAWQAQ
ncbi:hypothetical protein DSO57_1000176 [Entomophthora muscae]|uniref:Uncharacterized protein n=1 Tax=Entomophthora muscae TaxID=34485 RepID=A0ACC2T9M3_9FUNG|nr:hypothetical protein DSO57_1000176 [Entomophthora muscae]